MDNSTLVSRRKGVLLLRWLPLLEPERTSVVVNLPAVLPRALPLPTSHGEQTRRPIMQNGGTARNGLQETGLMNFKSGMPVTTASGTIGSSCIGFEDIAQGQRGSTTRPYRIIKITWD